MTNKDPFQHPINAWMRFGSAAAALAYDEVNVFCWKVLVSVRDLKLLRTQHQWWAVVLGH